MFMFENGDARLVKSKDLGEHSADHRSTHLAYRFKRLVEAKQLVECFDTQPMLSTLGACHFSHFPPCLEKKRAGRYLATHEHRRAEQRSLYQTD